MICVAAITILAVCAAPETRGRDLLDIDEPVAESDTLAAVR